MSEFEYLKKVPFAEYLLKNAGFKTVTIEALDVGMTMGSLEDTVDYLTRMAGCISDS